MLSVIDSIILSLTVWVFPVLTFFLLFTLIRVVMLSRKKLREVDLLLVDTIKSYTVDIKSLRISLEQKSKALEYQDAVERQLRKDISEMEKKAHELSVKNQYLEGKSFVQASVPNQLYDLKFSFRFRKSLMPDDMKAAIIAAEISKLIIREKLMQKYNEDDKYTYEACILYTNKQIAGLTGNSSTSIKIPILRVPRFDELDNDPRGDVRL